YVLTDFRRTDWLTQPDEKEAKELAARGGGGSRLQIAAQTIKASGPGTSLIIMDAGHDDTTNLGVVDLYPQEKLVVTGIPERLVGKVKNWGKQPVSNVALELKVGANRVPLEPIAVIQPGETKQLEITYT